MNCFDDLKERTNHYFLSNNIKRTGNKNLYVKSVILISSAVLTYAALIFFTLPGVVSLFLCLFLGLLLAAIGFNVMHDAAHGSFSTKKWLNDIMAYSLNIMGGNVYIWKNKHNVNHHSFTNMEGMDDDIDLAPWIRTIPSQKKYWFHRYQHIYWVLLYGATYILWVFITDFKRYFAKRIGATDLQKMSTAEHINFWLSKLLYFTLFLAIPVYKFGFLETFFGFTVMAFVCGFTLGIVFQLAHLHEDAEFLLNNEKDDNLRQDWVSHQASTTANFAIKSKMMFWFTGGLNFQVVHHIFPKISHIHYPVLNRLTKESCNKFKIKYVEYATFISALRSHVSYLKKLGRN